MKKALCATILLQAWLLGVFSICASSLDLSQSRLILRCPEGYLPGHPMLVRIEIRNQNSSFVRDAWNADVILSADQEGVSLSTNRILVRNGLGSGLVVAANVNGDFALTAAVGSLQASRTVRSLTNLSITTVSGALAGLETAWSNIINVTADLTVPAGHTLTIEPGTLVLINGVNSGNTAPDLHVAGRIRSLGTEERPVTITCSNMNPGFRWGQIRHDNAELSLYRHTSIVRGGRCPGEGHTGQGPVFRLRNSRVHFENCNLTDYATAAGTPGKVMQANRSDITLNECALQRARMGPEISDSSFLCTNTWITDMKGPDDADGVYPHSQGAGQQIHFVGCVMANGDDDGIDTLGSTVTVEDCIVRDWSNPGEDAKGISGFNGTIYVRRCLFANCFVGLSTKSSSSSPARMFIDQSTILGLTNGVLAAWKSNATNGIIDIRITNSIVRAPAAIRSDFGPTNFTVEFCNSSEPWPGAGNFTADPMFVDTGAYDYRLQPYSPCIDTGSLSSSPDMDGSAADVGYFTFEPPAPTLISPKKEPNGAFAFQLSAYTNRSYRVETSSNCVDWTVLTTLLLINEPATVMDLTMPGEVKRFYRVRLGP